MLRVRMWIPTRIENENAFLIFAKIKKFLSCDEFLISFLQEINETFTFSWNNNFFLQKQLYFSNCLAYLFLSYTNFGKNFREKQILSRKGWQKQTFSGKSSNI